MKAMANSERRLEGELYAGTSDEVIATIFAEVFVLESYFILLEWVPTFSESCLAGLDRNNQFVHHYLHTLNSSKNFQKTEYIRGDLKSRVVKIRKLKNSCSLNSLLK